MAKVTFQPDICKGCGLCIAACKKELLGMAKEKIKAKGQQPGEMTEESECVGCTNCATLCPDCVITVER